MPALDNNTIMALPRNVRDAYLRAMDHQFDLTYGITTDEAKGRELNAIATALVTQHLIRA